MQAKGKMTEILVELAAGEKVLIVQIEIECERCVQPLRYVIPGHHLKLVRDMLTDAIDAHTDLPQETVRAGGRASTTIPGVPKDPSLN